MALVLVGSSMTAIRCMAVRQFSQQLPNRFLGRQETGRFQPADP